jgi:hypothetical protein
MKTYGDAAALLHTFLSSSPDPTSIGTGATPMDKLYRALTSNTGSFGPPPPPPPPSDVAAEREARLIGGMPLVELSVPWRDAAIFDKANLGAFWYQRAAQQPDAPSAPGWTLDDSLSTASMLAFAIPEVGAIMAAGISAFQHFVDNASQVRAAMQARVSLATTITDELEKFMSKQAVNQELRDVISRTTILKSHLHDMLVDPLRVTSAPRGLRADWVLSSRRKDWVLGPEYLGAVWDVVESDAFLSLMTESDAMPYQDGPSLNLIEAPSLSMCTVDAYMQITGVVVNALILYSLISLMPEEALQPNWDPTSFDLMTAVRSPAWNSIPNEQPGKSAYDCWETLRTYLDPNKKPSWISRIDPQTGDARKAFDKIKARLDRINFGFNLPKQRDNYWFLQADGSASVDLHEGSTANPDGEFTSRCVDGQSEVTDTALSTKQDTFAETYRNFRTTLGIHWSIGKSASDVAIDIFSLGTSAAGSGIATALLNNNHGRFYSPWSSNTGDGGAPGGSYSQLCWRPDAPDIKLFPVKINGVEADTAPPLLSDATLSITPPKKMTPDATWCYGWMKPIGFMDDPTGRDVVSWMGYVLTQYIADFNYKVDVGANVSTFSVAQMFYNGWSGVYQFAGTLLDAGAKLVKQVPPTIKEQENVVVTQ